jgi:hypothetical protein
MKRVITFSLTIALYGLFAGCGEITPNIDNVDNNGRGKTDVGKASVDNVNNNGHGETSVDAVSVGNVNSTGDTNVSVSLESLLGYSYIVVRTSIPVACETALNNCRCRLNNPGFFDSVSNFFSGTTNDYPVAKVSLSKTLFGCYMSARTPSAQSISILPPNGIPIPSTPIAGANSILELDKIVR